MVRVEGGGAELFPYGIEPWWSVGGEIWPAAILR